MKTTITNHLKVRVIIGLATLTLMSWLNVACGQKSGSVDQYLESLPANLELKEPVPQKYLMTAVYYNKDIYGNFFNKTQVKGEYTRGLEDGYVKWNNVSAAESDQLAGVFPEGQNLDYMENFKYKPLEDMLNEEAFEGFPVNGPYNINSKNLVWDMMGFEAFAWEFLDSLKINRNYAPAGLSGKVQLAGAGYFENRNIKLCWVGISKINGKLCAVIQFTAMDNPLEIDTEVNGMEISMKGRSHYWGNILVSLEDKQIEHAILYEDVVMKMNFSGSQDQLMNTTREIYLEKLN